MEAIISETNITNLLSVSNSYHLYLLFHILNMLENDGYGIFLEFLILLWHSRYSNPGLTDFFLPESDISKAYRSGSPQKISGFGWHMDNWTLIVGDGSIQRGIESSMKAEDYSSGQVPEEWEGLFIPPHCLFWSNLNEIIIEMIIST